MKRLPPESLSAIWYVSYVDHRAVIAAAWVVQPYRKKGGRETCKKKKVGKEDQLKKG